MDGRTQLPVIEFLKERFEAEYVDSITEPGPVRLLGDQPTRRSVQSILDRVNISVDKHKSKAIAIVAHYDCTGNLVEKETQLEQLATAVTYLKREYPNVTVTGLWVDDNWKVTEV